MKLPNGEQAVVDIRKLREYCLNSQANAALSRGQRRSSARCRKSSRTAVRCGFQLPSPRGSGKDTQHLDRAKGRRLAAAHELLCIIKRRFGMLGIEMHSVVALTEDLPEEGLVRGQVGAVVEEWDPGVYEVEFCDESGRAYAIVALGANQLMRLHHEPVHQAA
jgi:hypothetical protein